jgi:hypothetical protein
MIKTAQNGCLENKEGNVLLTAVSCKVLSKRFSTGFVKMRRLPATIARAPCRQQALVFTKQGADYLTLRSKGASKKYLCYREDDLPLGTLKARLIGLEHDQDCSSD